MRCAMSDQRHGDRRPNPPSPGVRPMLCVLQTWTRQEPTRLLGLLVIAAVLVGCGAHHAQSRTSLRIVGEQGIGPALGLDDVASGSADTTRDPNTGEPVVLMRFTNAGAQKFASLTRNLAHRGAALHRRLHLLISVNRRIVSRPYIDYVANPNGITAQTGIEITGLRTSEAARRLARDLNRR